jgi:hypothetical protein
MAERSPGGYGPSSSSTGFKHCSDTAYHDRAVAGVLETAERIDAGFMADAVK